MPSSSLEGTTIRYLPSFIAFILVAFWFFYLLPALQDYITTLYNETYPEEADFLSHGYISEVLYT